MKPGPTWSMPNLEYVGFENNELWVGRLPALAVPDEVHRARQRLYLLLPKKKLANLLIETAHWVDYLAPLREAAGEDIRIKNMDERLFAVLMAEGCNISLENTRTWRWCRCGRVHPIER